MNKIDNTYRYPCTQNIGMEGFGLYLEAQIKESRRNIRLFATELEQTLTGGRQDMRGQLVLTNSGSSANLVAALAMAEKLRQERKPLTAAASAFTFPTTMSALILAGFDIQLVDVDEHDFNLSVAQLEALASIPSLVVVTHFLGFPASMRRLMEYKQKNGCLILQDACETMVCRYEGVPVYKFGDMVTWSFYHPHHLSSYGGGAVYACRLDDYILCDSIAHWGRACKCHIDEALCTLPSGPAHQFTYENIGINVEMSELNACFGRWQLKNWQEIEEKRKRNYKLLYDLLKGHSDFKVWDFYNEEQNSPFVFPILSKSKTVREIWSRTKEYGIEIRTLMGGATSSQKAFQRFLFPATSCPSAEYMSEHAFFVGCHHTLSEEDVAFVGRTLLNL